MTFSDQLGCHGGRRCARFSELPMRRIVASFVVSVLAWSFISPLALAFTPDTTPACCRRTGKHHCMSGMTGMMISGEKTPAFRALPSCCPFRSTIATPSSVGQMAGARTTGHLSPSAILAHAAGHQTVSARTNSPFFQRGPPSQSL
jgi:hypothetical protein